MPSKPTTKKKSARSSQTSKPLDSPKIAIFDTTSGPIVGRVVEAKPNSFILEFPAQLHFKPVPEQGGERFKVMAFANPIIPFQYSVSPRYELMTAAVRGFHYNRTPSLVSLYEMFVADAATGKYDLNPFVPGPHVDMQVGAGTVEPPAAHVNTLEATKPAKPVETKPAEVKPKLEAVPTPPAETPAPAPAKSDAPPAA